jgi:HD-like signal output (HDOD) protein
MAIQIGKNKWDGRLTALHSRKERLITVATKEIAPAPSLVSELLILFDRQPADLKSIKRIIDNQPGLSRQVLRFCNAAADHEHRRILDLEEVSVLFGCEAMKQIVLRSFLLDFARRWLSPSDLRRFWQHSILTAALSERIAHLLGRGESDAKYKSAYLGGMFHDIGVLPLLVISRDENAVWEAPCMLSGSLAEEKNRFGLDHCEIAKIIGPSWNLFPGCSEIIAHHHTPQLTPCHQEMVGFVAAADIICERYASCWAVVPDGGSNVASRHDLFALCFPNMETEARAELAEMLEEELQRLAKLPKLKREVFLEMYG